MWAAVILSGVWATFFMDILAKILSKRKLIHPFITREELGRWFLYLCKGRIKHKDIRQTQALRGEKQWYYLSHYLIGIVLAACYLLLSSLSGAIDEHAWPALVFGISTVVLPWFLLLPGTGFGFMANKSKKRKQIITANVINHTNFGIGLFLWKLLFHDLLKNI